jgi:serine kinase of HPr protein (carbohydrate metabolism regulator)
LLVRPADALAGLIELRGVGIVRCDHEPCAVVGLVVDLAVAAAERLPQGDEVIVLQDISLPRLAVAPDAMALPMVLAMIT